MSAIAALFDRFQMNGRVRMEYETRLYFGRFLARGEGIGAGRVAV
jgi:hypothetical protein